MPSVVVKINGANLNFQCPNSSVHIPFSSLFHVDGRNTERIGLKEQLGYK